MGSGGVVGAALVFPQIRTHRPLRYYTVERMYDMDSFEGWFDRRTLRLFDEPGRQVMVDMGRVDPSCGRPYAFAPGGVSLRVRAFGARIEPTMMAMRCWAMAVPSW